MTYALTMIVRNEAARIGPLLASVRPHVSCWTIVDTGSTDGTPEVIAAALDGIPGRLLERPWVNFGHNRSEAFAAARGTADWLLALDADMTVEITGDFEPDPDVAAYMIRMGNGADFEWRLPLLLRGDLAWESRGAVHEYTCLVDGGLGRREATDAVRVAYQEASSPEKSAWHAQLLEEEHERHPDDPRTVFYLAQTYYDLGDLVRAWAMYDLRVRMGGWDEELFYARYRRALLMPAGWGARRVALLDAWESRPWRLEPLHDLVSELNRQSQHHQAYTLSSAPRPRNHDVLFVHRGVWDWGLDFERSVAAWWVGELEESRRLGEALLERGVPANVRSAIEANLALDRAA